MRIILLLLLLSSSVAAFAADPPGRKSQTPAAPHNIATSCGTTVTEGMQRVHEALAANDPASQRLALACLAQIVSAMNDKIAALDTEVRHNSTGRVNVTTEPVLGQSR